MKKVGIIGHFGIGHNLANGQTVKTTVIYQALGKEYDKENIAIFDTYGGILFLLKMPYIIFKALFTCRNIVILPAHKGLCIITPILLFFNILYNRPIHYIVIGGWLPSMLTSKKWLRKMVKSFKCIYVETETLNKELQYLQVTNTVTMPNFKFLRICDVSNYQQEFPYKLCTFSRVTKEKGIEEAINAVRRTNEQLGRVTYSLDIYGQIEDCNWFEQLMKNQPEFIKYKGCIDSNQSTHILKEYFALLFPTYYKGECFAGTIIDAFSAGLPVFASDWHENPNIIKDKQTGIIYQAKSTEAIIETLLHAYQSPNEIIEMRSCCIKEAKKYQPEEIIKILTKNLE